MLSLECGITADRLAGTVDDRVVAQTGEDLQVIAASRKAQRLGERTRLGVRDKFLALAVTSVNISCSA
jgi:hypothetical protein